jgi:hypothetical protein
VARSQRFKKATDAEFICKEDTVSELEEKQGALLLSGVLDFCFL